MLPRREGCYERSFTIEVSWARDVRRLDRLRERTTQTSQTKGRDVVTEFVVMTPYSHHALPMWRANHMDVVILEVENGHQPKRVDVRDKKIVCIVKRWNDLNRHGGRNTAFAKAERYARQLVANPFELRMRIASQTL